VCLSFVAQTDATALKAAGITPHDISIHSAYGFEYLFGVKDKRPDARICIILDLAGMTLKKTLSFDLISILKAVSDVSGHRLIGMMWL